MTEDEGDRQIRLSSSECEWLKAAADRAGVAFQTWVDATLIASHENEFVFGFVEELAQNLETLRWEVDAHPTTPRPHFPGLGDGEAH